MKLLYTIRDTVGEAIGPIVSHAADAAAVRMFGDVASDANTNVARHPADFELVCLGQVYDDGVIVPAAGGPRVVITGAAWKAANVAAEAANVAQS